MEANSTDHRSQITDRQYSSTPQPHETATKCSWEESYIVKGLATFLLVARDVANQ